MVFDWLTSKLFPLGERNPMSNVIGGGKPPPYAAILFFCCFWGLSARPMMPVAIKMLFSKKRLPMDESLMRRLKVTKEDVRLMKHYNMMTVL